MRARTARGSFLDPRTKILIWLLANVVVFTWAPAVFRIAVMLAYFGLFLLERKGKMLAGLLLGFILLLIFNPAHAIGGLEDMLLSTQQSQLLIPFEEDGPVLQ